MATLERMDVKLALIPLLSRRIEIDQLVLVKPDIMLETNAQGRPNWQFTPQTSPSAPQPGAAVPQKSASAISVADVRIENGTLTWRDDVTGRNAVLGLTSARATAASPDSDLHVTASATYNGAPFTLAGDFGPLTRLRETGTSGAWPAKLQMEAAGAKLALDGTIAQPQEVRGYAIKVAANVPDLAALAPFLPGQRLPPLHDVSLAAQVADNGAAGPQISGLTLHVGPSDLSGTVAGLKLDKLDVTAPQLDQPAHVAAQGSFDNSPATLAGTVGAPAGLLLGAKAAAPIPIDLDLHALGSNLTVKGTAARTPDGRPSVQAAVASDMIDLDAVSAALAQPTAHAAAAPTAPPVAKPATSGHVIPDTPIPFGPLRLANADVKLSVAQLKSRGVLYRAIATHLSLQDGRLQLDPVTADLPEGHLDATLSVDATQASPPVALRLRIPVLALKPLLAAMGEPDYINGNMNVQADLHGAGATPHAIAASLDGSLGSEPGQRNRGQPSAGQHAGIGAARGEPARSGRSRRDQPSAMLRRPLGRKPWDRHRAVAGVRFVTAQHGWGWQPEPWQRNARSARAARDKDCRNWTGGADADHWPVQVAEYRARPNSDSYSECGHRGGSRCWAARRRWD